MPEVLILPVIILTCHFGSPFSYGCPKESVVHGRSRCSHLDCYSVLHPMQGLSSPVNATELTTTWPLLVAPATFGTSASPPVPSRLVSGNDSSVEAPASNDGPWVLSAGATGLYRTWYPPSHLTALAGAIVALDIGNGQVVSEENVTAVVEASAVVGLFCLLVCPVIELMLQSLTSVPFSSLRSRMSFVVSAQLSSRMMPGIGHVHVCKFLFSSRAQLESYLRLVQCPVIGSLGSHGDVNMQIELLPLSSQA